MKIFLTGKPGCGKTTVILRTLELWPGPARGIVTEELRSPGGGRTGFSLRTLSGERADLAKAGVTGGPRVGKYRVFIDLVDRLALPALEPPPDQGTLIVIDEVGKMECLSAGFREAVDAVLDAPHPVLGTVPLRAGGYPGRLRSRTDVEIVHVTPENRDALPAELAARLQEGS
ncbi:MAG: nucleoside-triphosphatase [Planctomycetota bacterium]|jgi:nucleoside-triphosphatase